MDNWLQPRWDCKDPAIGASHKECWEWREAAAPTTRKKGKGEEEMAQEGGGLWSEETHRTQQDRDGLEKGVVNPGVLGKC